MLSTDPDGVQSQEVEERDGQVAADDDAGRLRRRLPVRAGRHCRVPRLRGRHHRCNSEPERSRRRGVAKKPAVYRRHQCTWLVYIGVLLSGIKQGVVADAVFSRRTSPHGRTVLVSNSIQDTNGRTDERTESNLVQYLALKFDIWWR